MRLVSGNKRTLLTLMNYHIEKHDMNIILDALENLVLSMKNTEAFGLPNNRAYSIDEIDGLFQSFDNSGEE